MSPCGLNYLLRPDFKRTLLLECCQEHSMHPSIPTAVLPCFFVRYLATMRPNAEKGQVLPAQVTMLLTTYRCTVRLLLHALRPRLVVRCRPPLPMKHIELGDHREIFDLPLRQSRVTAQGAVGWALSCALSWQHPSRSAIISTADRCE